MIEHLTAERFDEASREALGNEQLRRALAGATDTIGARRAAAVGAVEDWQDLRERARAIKAETLARLDEHLERFVERAEARGTRVHWARDAAEARALLEDIARASGASTIVKSKSMTTEEIGLNDALEAAGYAPVETDLGEWIVQLAGEHPSHIIVPAIHKTREEIGRLFAEKLRVEETGDPAELTRIARELLREEFAGATLGISGVNFAIAESGAFLVLENEGNARMSTSLPRVHVAVMGIEKVLPRHEDLEVFLRLLPRSGTGQTLTTYQSIFTGPKASPEDEGPEELHLVLLDNGRSAMLREEVTRQSLACIRCGACLNACPVYRQVGGHAYGSVYPGPIGAVITPQLAGIEKAEKLPFASSLCGACREVCPVAIDIPRLLLHLRGKVVAGEGGARPRPWRERLGFRLWALAMGGPRRYRLAAAAVRLVQPRAVRGGLVGALARRLSPAFLAWTRHRSLAPVAPRSFRRQWQERDR